MPRGDYTLGTLRKGLEVLAIFEEESGPLSFTEVSKRLGESSSVVFRIIKTLEEYAYLSRDPISRRYSLGFRIWEIGCKAISRMGLVETSMPILRTLTDDTGQTSFISTIRGTETVYLHVVDGVEPLRVYVEPGFRVPLYLTASGKAMAAFRGSELVTDVINRGMKRLSAATITNASQLHARLNEIRLARLSINRGERRPEIWAIAAPIFNGTNECVASVGVTGPSSRFQNEFFDKFSKSVRKASEEISIRLGHVLKERIAIH